jgi:hypothetical protein
VLVLKNLMRSRRSRSQVKFATLTFRQHLADLVVEEDDEMDEDLEDEDLIAQGTDRNGDTPLASGVSINTPVTLSHLLQTLSLPQRLSTLSALTPLSFPPSTSTPSPHPPTTSLLSTIHLRALEALNNLLLTTVAGDAYQPASIPSQGVWDTLFKSVEMIASEPEVISAKGHEMRGEVLEMATGCLWGIVKLASDEIVSGPLSYDEPALISLDHRSIPSQVVDRYPTIPQVRWSENKSYRNPSPSRIPSKRLQR